MLGRRGAPPLLAGRRVLGFRFFKLFRLTESLRRPRTLPDLTDRVSPASALFSLVLVTWICGPPATLAMLCVVCGLLEVPGDLCDFSLSAKLSAKLSALELRVAFSDLPPKILPRILRRVPAELFGGCAFF